MEIVFERAVGGVLLTPSQGQVCDPDDSFLPTAYSFPAHSAQPASAFGDGSSAFDAAGSSISAAHEVAMLEQQQAVMQQHFQQQQQYNAMMQYQVSGVRMGRVGSKLHAINMTRTF